MDLDGVVQFNLYGTGQFKRTGTDTMEKLNGAMHIISDDAVHTPSEWQFQHPRHHVNSEKRILKES
jgi:hypothetical protein